MIPAGELSLSKVSRRGTHNVQFVEINDFQDLLI